MKKILIMACAAIIAVTGAKADTSAQISFSSLNQQIIESAVRPGLFGVRTSFQLQDRTSGRRYGRDGAKEFGVEYTLGVRVDYGFMLNDRATSPWRYNPDFNRFADRYDPVFYQADWTTLGDAHGYLHLDYDASTATTVTSDKLYYCDTDSTPTRGFEVDSLAGDKSGWLVWVSIERDEDLSNGLGKTRYTISRRNISVEPGVDMYKVDNPELLYHIIGGVYVVPTYPAVGVVAFKLCGVLVPDGDRWSLCCPFAQKELTITPVPESPAEAVSDDLVPVDGADQHPDELTPADPFAPDAPTVPEPKNDDPQIKNID